MLRDEARLALSSKSVEKRLAGARHFTRCATASDHDILRDALAIESVPWVKRALTTALARARSDPSPLSADEDGASDLASLDASQIYAKACEEIAGSIVHEFAPIVGILRVSVPLELGDAYVGSKSKRALDQLQGLLRAVRSLKRVAQAPNFTTFGLAALVVEIVEGLEAPQRVQVQQIGSQSLIVSADRDQLFIAISNGLRNAIEAAVGLPQEAQARVVISWGSTRSENYLIIKDNAGGFAGDPSVAKGIGRTTKNSHSGFGLALAEQAIKAMAGELILHNSEDGADFELRWFRDNEDTVR